GFIRYANGSPFASRFNEARDEWFTRPARKMKKLMPILGLLGGAVTALAQGTVTFQNSVAFQTPDPTGGARRVYEVGSPLDLIAGVGLVGTQFVAELYTGGGANSLAPLTLSISRFRATTTAFPGFWANVGI